MHANADAKRRERSGDPVIIRRRPLVAQRQQRDHLDSTRRKRARPAKHLLGVSTLKQVAQENENRLLWPPDQLLAICQRLIDVGSTTQLCAKQQIHRIVKILGEVHH